eukprot:809297-Prymnesium_polylepis.2
MGPSSSFSRGCETWPTPPAASDLGRPETCAPAPALLPPPLLSLSLAAMLSLSDGRPPPAVPNLAGLLRRVGRAASGLRPAVCARARVHAVGGASASPVRGRGALPTD